VQRFEWDERKADGNLAKHGIDFLRAIRVFDGLTYTQYSGRGGEERWMTVGRLDGRFVTIVWTWRGDVIRIISARRARDGEIRAYRALHPG
jgi:uncharacterized protein